MVIHRTFHIWGKPLFRIRCPQTQDGCSERAFAPRAFQRAVERSRLGGALCGKSDSGTPTGSALGDYNRLQTIGQSVAATNGIYSVPNGRYQGCRGPVHEPAGAAMIASALWMNNGHREVIHRFHKRESCVFHSIHRFEASFRNRWKTPLTCGNT